MPEKKLDQFRVKDESNRAKLILALAKKFGQPIPVIEVMDAVYGKRNGSATAFARVVHGVRDVIDKRQLPYEVVEAKTKRGKTIGLYPIEQDSHPLFTTGATIAAINPKGRLAGDD